MSTYDYIIIGAGASGLLLADALGSDNFFADKSILILDKDTKAKNDRTWCFWEVGNGTFDHLVHKKWETIYFAGKKLRKSSSIQPYHYKMLRGIDFYTHYLGKINTHPNVTLIHDAVEKMQEKADEVHIKTSGGMFVGKKVFNSIFNPELISNQNKYPVIQQHFLGWFVKTKKPVFDSNKATFMDFSIPQKGNTRFMYVLPFSENEALLEYTLFSENLLEKSEYENAIQDYIQQHLDNTSFEILDTEQGSIPMTCYPFNDQNTERVFHIGISGGWAKPSTGFTFYNTHKKVKKLVSHLKMGKSLARFHNKDKFWYYDLLLLDILYRHNHLGQSIFESLFKRRKASLILKFLDNDTSIWEDVKIMSAPKPLPFIKALFGRIFRPSAP